jgi:hypothetical protein
MSKLYADHDKTAWRTNPVKALDGIGNAIEIETDGHTVAMVHPHEDMDKYAAIICAAPSMLAFVQQYQDARKSADWCYMDQWADEILQAVAASWLKAQP